MNRVLVLGCKFFDFIGNDGKPVQFARLFYVSDEIEEKNTFGMVVGQLNVSLPIARRLGFDLPGNLPAICDLDFKYYFDYTGKPQVKLDDAIIVKALDMGQLMVI